MNSMTGFGRSEADTTLGKLVVEARSENHRFLDITFQLPDFLHYMESQLADHVKKFVTRGKVRIAVVAENSRGRTPVLNLDAAKRVAKALGELRDELSIADEVKIEHILMVREVFGPEESPPPTEEQAEEVIRVVTEAVVNLNKMRKAEGTKLRRDLKRRVERLTELIDGIEQLRSSFTEETMARMRERVGKLLEGVGVQIDEGRLAQEVAYLAERSDITEELVRLRAHTEKFVENFSRRGPVGRELDFLLQEMNREATTIAAKAKNATISHVVVELKAEMERIKEQVQNIE